MARDTTLVAQARATLAESPLFADLGAVALDTLAACAERVTLRGGETLFSVGDPPAAFYLVEAGRLRAILPNGQVAGEIGRLEPVGEVGVLSGEARAATVIALRDSLLYRFSREAYHAFTLDHPAALLAIGQVIISRMRQNAREARRLYQQRHRSFTVFSGGVGLQAHRFAQSLAEVLGRFGRVALLDASRVDEALGPGAANTPPDAGAADIRLLEWLSRIEAAHDYLVLDADGPEHWRRRALHQADRVLVLGEAATPPLDAPLVQFQAAQVTAAVDLVLERRQAAGEVLAWRQRYGSASHYFLRPGQDADLRSLARQLAGRGLGVVLGGGGARGFAHIGLMRALAELNLPVDLVGGTSMGAFVAALHASGHDWRSMTEAMRDTFVKRNLLSDYLLPRVALIAGKKLRLRLAEIFGDTQVEQLPMPYFCVSTNLTRGCAMVHSTGPLAAWVATSMCVPGVAPPVAFEGDLLADGAVVNSLPTDVMQGYGRGPIVASDVSTEGSLSAAGVKGPDFEAVLRKNAEGHRISLIDILFRVSTLTSESGTKARAALADAYLRMPVNGIATFAWKGLDEIVEAGYRHAMRELPGSLDKLRSTA